MSEQSDAAVKRYEYLKLGIMGFLFIMSVLLLARTIYLDNQVGELRDRYNAVHSRLDSLRLELHQTAEAAESPHFLGFHDLQILKNRGLSNPVNQLKSDLMNHPELIPHSGTHGGSMRFYRQHIYILTSRWAMAYFDDGHIAGYMLLSYEINTDGTIDWSVMDSYLG